MIGGAWLFATGAAITLSWFGVDTVLKGTVYDPPRALPVSGTPSGPPPEPDASSTQRPPPDGVSAASGTPRADAGNTGSTDTPEAPAGETTQDPPRDPPPGDTPDPAGEPGGAATASGGLGSVETVRTDGGRVAFDMDETTAELVSATPEPGWDMQVWTEPGWIRVTFTANGRELSVFCVWHDGAPRIERYES
jgi:hypothetical protein